MRPEPSRGWAKQGVLARVFAAMQVMQIIQIKVEVCSLDSTSVKVHPDGAGALKKRSAGHWTFPRRTYNQESHGCRK